MSKKLKNVLIIYVCAALAVLGIYSAVCTAKLSGLRSSALTGSGSAFEQSVYSVSNMSRALKKSLYAADSGMCAKLCAEIYADALAAETAMSSLPFSTQELEQASALVNTAGDYSYMLAAQVSERGFSDEEREVLLQLSQRAEDMAQQLEQLREGLNSRDIIMDSREENYGYEQPGQRLSAALLEYEAQLEPMELSYDGQYGFSETPPERGSLSNEEMLREAAEYLGIDAGELTREYDYSGSDGRSCFSAGDCTVCVSSSGVISFSSSRLPGEETVTQEQAEQIAEQYLRERGFEGVRLESSKRSGGTARLCFDVCEGDTVCTGNCVRVAVALDDGSIYAFDASDYCTQESGAEFPLSAEECARAVPQGLSVSSVRQVAESSPGKKCVACYEYSCTAQDGTPVKILVCADSGRQYDIRL